MSKYICKPQVLLGWLLFFEILTFCNSAATKSFKSKPELLKLYKQSQSKYAYVKVETKTVTSYAFYDSVTDIGSIQNDPIST